MAIRLAGEKEGYKEKVENIAWSPGVKDTGDLESGTTTVTATAKSGAADYSGTLASIPASPDDRLVANNIGVRLQITIDSMTAGQLNYSVEIDDVERIAGAFTGTGANHDGVNLAPADYGSFGAARTVKIYLWVDSGNAVVSVAQVWSAVGVYGTLTSPGPGSRTQGCLSFTHRGWVRLWKSYGAARVGSGTRTSSIASNKPDTLVGSSTEFEEALSAGQYLLAGKHYLTVYSTVETDLCYYREITMNVRSEE